MYKQERQYNSVDDAVGAPQDPGRRNFLRKTSRTLWEGAKVGTAAFVIGKAGLALAGEPDGTQFFGRKAPDERLADIIDSLDPHAMERLNAEGQYDKVRSALDMTLKEALTYDLMQLDRVDKAKLAHAFNELGSSKNANYDTQRIVEKEYLIAATLDPDTSAYWHNLASFYIGQRKNDPAIACLNNFIRLEPNDRKVPRMKEWIKKHSK